MTGVFDPRTRQLTSQQLTQQVYSFLTFTSLKANPNYEDLQKIRLFFIREMVLGGEEVLPRALLWPEGSRVEEGA